MANEGLLDRVPPHSEEAEIAVIGSCLIDHIATGLALEILKHTDFYKGANGKIFQVIESLYEESIKPDVVTVQAELETRKMLDSVGGAAYLREITDRVPSSANVEYYAEIVRSKALLRDLVTASAKNLEEIFDSGLDPREVLDEVEKRVFEIADSRSRSDEILTIGEILKQEWDEIERQVQSGVRTNVTGLPTGYADLDRMLAGLHEGELIIIAGRPSMGKTTLALNIAMRVAAPEGASAPEPAGVILFSLEMTRGELSRHMLSAASGVDGQKVRTSFLSQDELSKLQNVGMGRLYDAPILIDGSPSLSLMELRARARRITRSHGVKLVIVDYLQLMDAPRADNREQQVASISRGLKGLARELKIPVIAVSQLNRRPEREDDRPRLSDLRESGAIEQDADVVLMVHRPDFAAGRSAMVDGEDAEVSNTSTTEIIIAKQRNGPTGVEKLTFFKNTLRFEDQRAETVPYVRGGL